MFALAFSAAVVFVIAATWLASLLRRSSRWLLMGAVTALLAGSWALLLGLRIPRAVDVTLTFVLADVALFALGVLATMRLLGAWDAPPAAGGSDDEGGSTVDPGPAPPAPPDGRHRPRRHPRPRPTSPQGPRRPARPRRHVTGSGSG